MESESCKTCGEYIDFSETDFLGRLKPFCPHCDRGQKRLREGHKERLLAEDLDFLKLKEELALVPVRKCRRCRRQYQPLPDHTTGRYCSVQCKFTPLRPKKDGLKGIKGGGPRDCKLCGESFVPKGSGANIYCPLPKECRSKVRAFNSKHRWAVEKERRKLVKESAKCQSQSPSTMLRRRSGHTIAAPSTLEDFERLYNLSSCQESG